MARVYRTIAVPDAPFVCPDASFALPDASFALPDVPFVRPDVPFVRPDGFGERKRGVGTHKRRSATAYGTTGGASKVIGRCRGSLKSGTLTGTPPFAMEICEHKPAAVHSKP